MEKKTEVVRGTKRWPIVAALGSLMLIVLLSFAWMGTAAVHGIAHVAAANASPSPEAPQPVLTQAPLTPVVDPSPADSPFAMRPIRPVTALFVPATPHPRAATSSCCATVAYRSATTPIPGGQGALHLSSGTMPPSYAPTPAPAIPVIEHRLENMDFGSDRNRAQNAQAANDVGGSPAALTSIPPNYELPTARPSRYTLPSEFEIADTDFIRGKLDTAINSEVPGEIVAVITRPVLDSATHSIVLIPAGSKLHGDDRFASIGQNSSRLGIDWYEVVLPNLVTIPIGGQHSADVTGAAGVPGNVDTHQGRLFGRFVLYTLVNAVGNLIGRVSYLGTGSSLGATFSAGAESIRPTITIPANTDIDIYLSQPIADLRPWSEVARWAPR